MKDLLSKLSNPNSLSVSRNCTSLSWAPDNSCHIKLRDLMAGYLSRGCQPPASMPVLLSGMVGKHGSTSMQRISEAVEMIVCWGNITYQHGPKVCPGADHLKLGIAVDLLGIVSIICRLRRSPCYVVVHARRIQIEMRSRSRTIGRNQRQIRWVN